MDEKRATQAPTHRVSEHDRDYFRRLGEWEAENARLDRERRAAMPLWARLADAWERCRALDDGRPDPDEGWPEELYTRARRLGLVTRP